ncbi:unnamed protein product [Candida parapsilosis]|uniref:ANK_REP_REGION domain-containing protein n=1 Tax=Candida parapsilosis (strain CDC 317 / ATCC MYA-4646) TaxID=578454 RepID=G8BA23_CANPC|nr:uncharacterized protein CPAR2_804450 [Candida parapsilosis]CCE41895.1 hypothetical protein CPAR2_804450 [Candida parapsilosis]
MSYNSTHYTPRYNNNSSRKLHEQAKNDSKTTTGTTTSSASNTSSAPSSTSRVRDKNFTSSTGGASSSGQGPGYGRRDYYIGAGYASSTASSRSRYNDSYISSKSSNTTGPRDAKPSMSITPASSSLSSGHYGRSKDYRGMGERSSSYYGSTSASAIRKGGPPLLHRYGSSSKYSSDSKSGEKFISRAGPVTGSSGATAAKSNTNANTTSISSGYRDERRSKSELDESTSTVPTCNEKDVDVVSSKLSPPDSEPFISTTSRNVKGSSSRKSSVESITRKSIGNNGVTGANSIFDISRRDEDRKENIDHEMPKRAKGDFTSKSEKSDENIDPLLGHESVSVSKIREQIGEYVPKSVELENTVDRETSSKEDAPQVDEKIKDDNSKTGQSDNEKTSASPKDMNLHQETSSDTSRDQYKEEPESIESGPAVLESSPPSTSSSSALSTSTGMKKTSLSDYLKKSKIKKKAIESATKLDVSVSPSGDQKVSTDGLGNGAGVSNQVEVDDADSRSREDDVIPVTNIMEDVKMYVDKEESKHKETDQPDSVENENSEKSLSEKVHGVTEDFVDDNDSNVTRMRDREDERVEESIEQMAQDDEEDIEESIEPKDQVDEDMKDVIEGIPDSIPELSSNDHDVKDESKYASTQQTPEAATSVKFAEIHSDTQLDNDKEMQTTDKTEILSTPRTKLSRSDSYGEDISTLSPVNESEFDTNFNFNDIGTMPEIPEENEAGEKEAKDVKVVSKQEKPQHSFAEKEDDDMDKYSITQDKDDLSEAETVIGTPSPRSNQGVSLLKRKSFDSDRHTLKKKKVVISSSEEDNAEEEANPQRSQKPSDDESTEKKASIPEPRSATSIESKEKKNVSGKAIKKAPYKVKRDSSGRSLLQRACKKGNIEDVRDFLNRGASANEKDFCGFTCLHEAALEGHVEIVQLLIAHGANVNAKADEAGDCETPLIDAAENMHLETVEILLKNNADPTIFNIDGFTALTKIYNEHSDEEGYEDIIKVLEEATSKYTGRKTIVTTSQSGPQEETEFEIIDDPNEFYFAGLIKRKGIFKWAAENQKEVVASHFVAGNSLEDKPDILILAARNGHSELIDIILGLNPTPYNIDTESKCGVTALLASVGRGHFDVVQSLLSKGADPFKTRKKDGLTALQIVQHSPHFDPREVEIIQEAMEKKSGTKVVSAVHSRIVSRATSRATSRAPSVPVSDEESDDRENHDVHDEDDDEETVGPSSKVPFVDEKEPGAAVEDENDKMDIEEPEKVKFEEHENDHRHANENVSKKISMDEEIKKEKYVSEPSRHEHHDKEHHSKKIHHEGEPKKRKHEHEPVSFDHSLKKAKSESSVKQIEKKLTPSASTAALKPSPSDSTVPKLHNHHNNKTTSEKSTSSPNVVTAPSHDYVADAKVKARSPPPSSQPTLSAAALEEQKVKSAEEARVWQEKVEAKKKARREMFLKLEKEKELKKKEEEEKRLEEERELAELKREQDLKLAQELERKSKLLEAKKAAITQKKLLDYYPIGLRKLKLNSQPTDASIAKYLPLYVFVINDVEYVLDLQFSLLTLTKFIEIESQLTINEEQPFLNVESDDKVKLWKLFYKFIGMNHKLSNVAEIIKFRKQGEQLFDNLLMRFIPYTDEIKAIIERQFPQVYHKVNESKPVAVLLDSLRGFDDLADKSAQVNNNEEEFKEQTDGVDGSDVNVKSLPRFIPPHLSYRKDILKTVKAACNPLW